MRSLYFAGSSHSIKRYIRNCKLRQCFHCWDYEHYIHQCFVEKFRYKKCADFHDKKNCHSKFNKCAICDDKHTVIANSCSRRKNELKKLSKTKNAQKTFYVVKSKASVETFSFDHESFLFPCLIDLLTATAAQKEKKINDESEEKESDKLINTQLISSKTNDSFSKSKKVNSKNLNIIAMKEKIIAKLKTSNKNLMKQFLIKIKFSINKRKTTDSSDSSSNLSFMMMFREKRQTTHTRK